MGSVKLEPLEPSLMGDLGAQHKALHQVVNLRNSHLPRSAEQEMIKQLGKEPRLPRSDTDGTRSERRVPRQTSRDQIRALSSCMRDLHDSQSPMGRIDDSVWASVNRFGEVFERLKRGFIENVGNDHVSSEGYVGSVNLDVPGEHEPPSSSTPILVHLDVRGGGGATSEVRCVLVHRSLQRNG
jgi:hypothetical protein